MSKIKWGILGPGEIANDFVKALKVLPEAEIFAVASREKNRALGFGKQYGINENKCYGSYEELLKDNEVDAVYIAVPHVFHKELSLKSLKYGKAVLCEKPVAMNEKEIVEVVEMADKNSLFFMEAMWTRFLPVMKKVQQWVRNGNIGKLQIIQADFGFKGYKDPEGRLFNKRLGGGALLDVGIYTISLSSYLFGNIPEIIKSAAFIGDTEIDEQTSISFSYKDGGIASLYCSINANTPQQAHIIGDKGRIFVPDFWKAERATLFAGGQEETINIPFVANGYEYEAQEVINCLKAGKTQSEIMNWKESVEIMRIMDTVQSQWAEK
jgi:dihydrodiol dehydrogenase / D-xylose 1-dehydrogenase (NADP)